jgi:hypothetical protein
MNNKLYEKQRNTQGGKYRGTLLLYHILSLDNRSRSWFGVRLSISGEMSVGQLIVCTLFYFVGASLEE